MTSRSTRRLLVAAAVLLPLLVSLLAACGGGSEGSATTTSTTTSSAASPEPGADDRRVVALGEEFLLADLLALGITPVASTATVAEEGFVGLDESATDGIEALPSTEPNVERLAALAPDVIVATPFVVDELGEEVLTGLAELVVVDAVDPRASIEVLGAAFERTERAQELVTALDEAVAAGRGRLPEDLEVSVATVYPGPSLAVWVAGPATVPSVLDELGVTMVPGPADVDASDGRAFISSERLDLLSAPTMLLLQSSIVDGEAAALDELSAERRWTTLPAVADDRVIELDRLAFPGIVGRTEAVDVLVEQLGGE
jgi:iron complex transport system substrate-binding protein